MSEKAHKEIIVTYEQAIETARERISNMEVHSFYNDQDVADCRSHIATYISMLFSKEIRYQDVLKELKT